MEEREMYRSWSSYIQMCHVLCQARCGRTSQGFLKVCPCLWSPVWMSCEPETVTYPLWTSSLYFHNVNYYYCHLQREKCNSGSGGLQILRDLCTALLLKDLEIVHSGSMAWALGIPEAQLFIQTTFECFEDEWMYGRCHELGDLLMPL